MKFILNETIKHILSEKFILLEAVTVTDITDLRNNLLTVAKNIATTKETSEDQDTADLINEKIFVLQHALDAVTNKFDPAAIKGQCSQTIQQIEQILSKANSSFQKTAFNKEFSELKTLATNSNYDKTTVKAIKEKLQLLSNALDTLVTDYESKDEDNTDNTKVINDTATLLASLIEYAKQSTKANALSPVDSSLTACVTAYNTYSADNTKLTELVSSCQNLSENIKDLFAAENFTASATNADDADWDKRFKKAADKEIFWDQYYKEVWGNNEQRIRSLGEAFRQECEALGFSSKTNPFIGFLQNYLVSKNYNIQKETYNVIHNAVREKKLSLKGLTSTTNIINPIFCKDFYSKNAGEAKEYLDAVERIKNNVHPDVVLDANAADKIDDPDERSEFTAVISHFNAGDRNITQFIWVLLFDNPSLGALLSNGSPESLPTTVGEVEAASLRPLVEIQKLLDILAPNLGADKAFTTDTMTVLLNKFPSTEDEAAKWVRVLIMTFMLPVDAEEFYKNYSKINAAKVTGVDEVSIKKVIFGLGTKMSKKNIQDIINSLKESKGIDLK